MTNPVSEVDRVLHLIVHLQNENYNNHLMAVYLSIYLHPL